MFNFFKKLFKKNDFIFWLIGDDFFKIDYDKKIKVKKQLMNDCWIAKIDRWELKDPVSQSYKKLKNQTVIVERVEKVNEINGVIFVKITDKTLNIKK